MNTNIQRITSVEKPSSVQYLNDGSYYYNYDIKEVEIPSHNFTNDEDTTILAYSFIRVHLWGNANYKDCVDAIIRVYLTINEEFDLINSYNKAIIQGALTDDDKNKYLSYLTLLDVIKSNVKKDLN